MGIEIGRRAVCDICGTQTVFVAGSEQIFTHAILNVGWSLKNGWETLMCPGCRVAQDDRPAAAEGNET